MDLIPDISVIPPSDSEEETDPPDAEEETNPLDVEEEIHPSNFEKERCSSRKLEDSTSGWMQDSKADDLAVHYRYPHSGGSDWVRILVAAPAPAPSAHLVVPPRRSRRSRHELVDVFEIIDPSIKPKNFSSSPFAAAVTLAEFPFDDSALCADHPLGPETEGVDYCWLLYYNSRGRPCERKSYYSDRPYRSGTVNYHHGVLRKWCDNENDVRFVNMKKSRIDSIERRYVALRSFHLSRFRERQDLVNAADPDLDRKLQRGIAYDEFLANVYANPRPDLIPFYASHPTKGIFQIPETTPSNSDAFNILDSLYEPDDQWPLDQVLTWLAINEFSNDWQETFEGLNLHGFQFLELGSIQGGRGHSGLFHQQVYPRLAKNCMPSGTGWNREREREEGKCLRGMIRSFGDDAWNLEADEEKEGLVASAEESTQFSTICRRGGSIMIAYWEING